jgi:hypothetical protein
MHEGNEKYIACRILSGNPGGGNHFGDLDVVGK